MIFEHVAAPNLMPPARGGSGRRASAAIVCFMPDFGHLQPLLKIADALAASGCSIKCYIADECSPLMTRFGFAFSTLENTSRLKQTKHMEKIFSRSIFFNSVCLYAHYLLMYPRVAESVRLAADKLQQELQEQRPDIIICDGLWFVDLYARMAAAVGAPLIINSLDGSLAYSQRGFVKTYGISTISPVIQSGVEVAAAVSKQLCACVYRVRYFRQWLRVRAAKQAAKAAFDTSFPLASDASPVPEWIVVGTAPLERERLKKFLRWGRATRREFPPLRFRSRIAVPETLRQWIEAESERPIVYVSFGSAVDLDPGFAQAVYTGLRELPARVLWSLPTAQQKFVAELPSADNIRLESFVPQAEILEMAAVRCFVTQAGPHSVQEAMFGGTPMVCVPFFVDQAYNSAVVEHLGVGSRLWRSDISPRTLSAAVRQILADRIYLENVCKIRDDLLRQEGGKAVVRYLSEVMLSPSSSSSRAMAGKLGAPLRQAN